MIKTIIQHTVPNYQEITDKKVRECYSIVGGILGIICNILLCLGKLGIGTYTGSIAIISDAFNNLSDMCSSVISILGAKLSNKPADAEHPFGHGRFEYLASLSIAILILIVGFSLCETSFHKFFQPIHVEQSYIGVFILLFSIAVKLWMYSYNTYIGKTIRSGVNLATAADSITDAVATGGVLLATLLQAYTTLPLDAVAGLLIGLLIMYTGFTIAKDVINILLGKAPDPQLVREITDCARACHYVTGVHEIRIHDYGPGRMFASMHVEIPDTTNLVEAHAVLDNLEDELQEKYNMEINLHMDPLCTNPQIITRVRHCLNEIIQTEFPRYETHHLRITAGMVRLNVICDLYVPPGELEIIPLSIIRLKINEALQQYDRNYHIFLDKVYELPKSPNSKVLSSPWG